MHMYKFNAYCYEVNPMVDTKILSVMPIALNVNDEAPERGGTTGSMVR